MVAYRLLLSTLVLVPLLLWSKNAPSGGFVIEIGDCFQGPMQNQLTFTLSEKEVLLMTEGMSYLITFADGTVKSAVMFIIDNTTVYFAFKDDGIPLTCGSHGGPISITG